MHFIIFVLFVHVNSIVCQNEKNKTDQRVQDRYYLNHPPWAKDDPIPVSVLYEDDSITGKSIKVEENIRQKPDSNIEEVNLTNEANEENITTERIDTSTTFKKSITESEQDDILVKPKARALSHLQIPVAVVYDDTTPKNIQNLQPVKASNTNNSRIKYRRMRRRKQNDKTIIDNEKPIIPKTEPDKLKIKTVDYIEPQTKNIESGRPQLMKAETVKSQLQPDFVPTLVDTNIKSTPRKRVRDPVVPIINSENYVFSHSGNFHYSYEGGDGTKAHSEGKLMRSVDDDKLAGEAVSGGYSYTDKDGNDFSLSYTADERGYRPIGAHLPTPPPIPPAIARALAYLATATTPEPMTKPSVKKPRHA